MAALRFPLQDHQGDIILGRVRTQELLEAEMSPCTPAQVTQSTAALANYWIATVKLSGPATVLVGGPTEIECLDLVGDLTCRPVKIERR